MSILNQLVERIRALNPAIPKGVPFNAVMALDEAMERIKGKLIALQTEVTKLHLTILAERNLMCATAWDLGQRGSVTAEDFVLLEWAPPPEPPKPEPTVQPVSKGLVTLH